MDSLKNRWEEAGQKIYDLFILLYTLDLQLINTIVLTMAEWIALPEKATNGLKHLILIIPQF